VIGLYQEPGWETGTALFLPETTDSFRSLAAAQVVEGTE
jgi:hypothetical protein